jgi:hypothetical protein
MNSSHIIVVFYSKFSDACKIFISKIKDIDEIKNSVQLVCIDNKKVRKIIQDNKSLSITKLPCLFKIYDSGDVELFEGEDAYNALNTYVTVKPITEPIFITPLESEQSSIPVREQPYVNIKKEPVSLALKAQMMQKERDSTAPSQNSNMNSQYVTPL